MYPKRLETIKKHIRGSEIGMLAHELWELQDEICALRNIVYTGYSHKDFDEMLNALKPCVSDTDQALKTLFQQDSSSVYTRAQLSVIACLLVGDHVGPGRDIPSGEGGGAVGWPDQVVPSGEGGAGADHDQDRLKRKEYDTTVELKRATRMRYNARVKLDEQNRKLGAIHVEYAKKIREQKSCQTALDVAKQALQASQQALDKATQDCEESKQVHDKVKARKTACETAWEQADQACKDASEKQRLTFLEQNIPDFEAESAAKRPKRDA
jgi:hypothetical protein